MRILRFFATIALLILLTQVSVSSAFGHHATDIDIAGNCTSWTVEVGYAQFGNGHRLVVNVEVDDQAVANKTFTPNGTGTVTVTGSFDGSGTVEVVVTTPDDRNPPMYGSETFALQCATPVPEPTPTVRPTPTPAPSTEVPLPSSEGPSPSTPPDLPDTATATGFPGAMFEGEGLFVTFLVVILLAIVVHGQLRDTSEDGN
jgi:hypothetical protein